jgi:hypothetical protein
MLARIDCPSIPLNTSAVKIGSGSLVWKNTYVGGGPDSVRRPDLLSRLCSLGPPIPLVGITVRGSHESQTQYPQSICQVRVVSEYTDFRLFIFKRERFEDGPIASESLSPAATIHLIDSLRCSIAALRPKCLLRLKFKPPPIFSARLSCDGCVWTALHLAAFTPEICCLWAGLGW